MARPHWMLDLINSSIWPNDGPVLLRRPPKPLDDVLVVDVNKGPALLQETHAQKILRILPGRMLSTAQLAMRLGAPMGATLHVLLVLERRGQVQRHKTPRALDLEWTFTSTTAIAGAAR